MSTLKLNQVDFKKRKYKYSLYCHNCGKNNHLYNQCHNPITSYGICCFFNPSNFIDINKYFEDEKKAHTSYAVITKNNKQNTGQSIETKTDFTTLENCIKDSIKYNNNTHRYNEFRLLMINRKYSLAFMEFMRGKYDVDNSDYIYNLFQKMTVEELDLICKLYDFIKIRKFMNFYNNTNKKFMFELDNAKLKFNYISKLGILTDIITKINNEYKLNLVIGNTIGPPPGLYNNNEYFKTLTRTNQSNNTLYTDCEWLLPKGKREENETDLKTAIREFYEETGINPKYISVYKNIVPFEYTFIGINGIEYRNIYFVAELTVAPKTVKFKYDTATYSIILQNLGNKFLENNKEVSNIELLSLKQCKDKTRDYETKFRDYLQHVFNFYINFRKFFD
jgi:8-oxo-dGTP pyrophosphatase MutT (NUDIX family)